MTLSIAHAHSKLSANHIPPLLCIIKCTAHAYWVVKTSQIGEYCCAFSSLSLLPVESKRPTQRTLLKFSRVVCKDGIQSSVGMPSVLRSIV